MGRLLSMHKRKSGFTLTELIIVVTILGILAVLVTPMISSIVDTANANADDSNAVLMSNAIARAIANQASPGIRYDTGADNRLETQAAAAATVANVFNAITAEIGRIPTVKQGGAFKFWIKLTGAGAGQVTCAAADPDTIPDPVTTDWVEFTET